MFVAEQFYDHATLILHGRKHLMISDVALFWHVAGLIFRCLRSYLNMKDFVLHFKDNIVWSWKLYRSLLKNKLVKILNCL